MLVLSRKVQQQILIPDLNIRITVLSVGTNRVQLGIEAPAGIQVTRPEIARTVLSMNAGKGAVSISGQHSAGHSAPGSHSLLGSSPLV